MGVLAYEAVLGGETLHGWFPALPSWVGSLLLLAIFVGTNLISVRTFGEVEFWLASVKVLAIVVFLGAGVLFAFGLWPNATYSIPNLWEHGGFAPNGFGVAFTGVALVIFSYFGTEIAVMASAESEDPAKGIRQATSTVIWRILLFFVGAVLVITTIVPWDELPEPVDVASAPFTYVFELFGLPGAAIVMQLVIFTAVISVLNSGLYSASRMFSSLAEQGFAPRFVAKKAKNGVPVAALLASTIGGVVATVVNFAAPDSGVFAFIMNSAGLVALFVYVFIALTQMRMRQKMTPEEVAGLKLKMWLHPWLNLLLIAAIVAVLIIMLTTEEGRTQVWTSLIATGVLVVCWPFVRRCGRSARVRRHRRRSRPNRLAPLACSANSATLGTWRIHRMAGSRSTSTSITSCSRGTTECTGAIRSRGIASASQRTRPSPRSPSACAPLWSMWARSSTTRRRSARSCSRGRTPTGRRR